MIQVIFSKNSVRDVRGDNEKVDKIAKRLLLKSRQESVVAWKSAKMPAFVFTLSTGEHDD